MIKNSLYLVGICAMQLNCSPPKEPPTLFRIDYKSTPSHHHQGISERYFSIVGSPHLDSFDYIAWTVFDQEIDYTKKKKWQSTADVWRLPSMSGICIPKKGDRWVEVDTVGGQELADTTYCVQRIADRAYFAVNTPYLSVADYRVWVDMRFGICLQADVLEQHGSVADILKDTQPINTIEWLAVTNE